MTSNSGVHQRHVPVHATGNRNSELSNGNVSKVARKSENGQRRRRRLRRKATWQHQMLSFAMTGMAIVFVWLFFGRKGSIRVVSSVPKFELSSDSAPECTPQESVDAISYTLVTQLSHNRLWMMEHHCQRFPHSMSIAVWTNSTKEDVLQELESLGCNLDLIKVQVLDATVFGSDTDYPVNHLRNLALSQVDTSHIIYIDVDFWTSENLFELLMTDAIRESLLEHPKLALVIPAFQLFRQCREWTDCREENLPHMPFSSTELREMLNQKRGHVFDPTNKGGHGSTLYAQWIKQTPGTLLEIPCLQSNRYEPFVVLRFCRNLPPFQNAFSGYGKNKMAWAMHLIRTGYTFSQVGGAYLCHYPHLDSTSRQHWNEAPPELKVGDQVRKPKASDGNLHFSQYKRGKVDQVFIEFREWLHENLPDQSRMKPCEGAQDDDTKLWIEHSLPKD